MVQEIVPTRLGNELGQSLQQGAARGSEMAVNRGMLQQALGGLSNMPANATGFDLAKQLISSTAGIPGAEKYVGQLFPLLLQQMRGKALFGNQGGQAGMGGGMGSAPGGPMPAGAADSTGTIPGAPTVRSAEDVQRLAQEYAAMGGDPSEVLNYYQAQNAFATQQQDLFRSEVARRIGSEDPALLAVAQRMGLQKHFQGISDPALKADLVAKEVQKYEATRDAFMKDAAERPNALLNHVKYDRKIKALHTNAKPLVEMGQYDQAFQDLAQNGWSQSEIAQILNPLSPETKSSVAKIPSFRPFNFTSREGKENSLKSSQRLEKDIQRLVKPGDVNAQDPNLIKPGTSLLLLRNEFLRKGVPGYVFDTALNRLIESGRLKLDPTQSREKQTVDEPSKSFSIWETLFGPK